MVCIYCGFPTSVVNSRPQQQSNHIWRRRKCDACAAIFTTREAPELSGAYTVRGLSGKLEPFSRNRLFIDIYDSCKHRASSLDDAEALTQTIIDQLTNSDGVIGRNAIVETSVKVLERFDPTASLVYLAYHPITD
jgi:transcriptional repressor NrdR